jgi:RecB family exonuclease
LSPLERGRLFHELLEHVYHRLAEAALLPLRAAGLARALGWLDERVARELTRVERESPERRLQRRASVLSLRHDAAGALAHEALADDDGDDRAVPTHFELRFGLDPDAGPAPALTLADGTTVRLHGVVDRVDLAPDGRFDVIDYKTGDPGVTAGQLVSTTQGKSTAHLQLALYLTAVAALLEREPRCAWYFLATADRDFRRVAFTAEDLRDGRERLEELLQRARHCAATGWFPSLPGTSCCRPEFAAACGASLTARYRGKLGDPELAAHLRVLRPDDPAAGAPA